MIAGLIMRCFVQVSVNTMPKGKDISYDCSETTAASHQLEKTFPHNSELSENVFLS